MRSGDVIPPAYIFWSGDDCSCRQLKSLVWYPDPTDITIMCARTCTSLMVKHSDLYCYNTISCGLNLRSFYVTGKQPMNTWGVNLRRHVCFDVKVSRRFILASCYCSNDKINSYSLSVLYIYRTHKTLIWSVINWQFNVRNNYVLIKIKQVLKILKKHTI